MLKKVKTIYELQLLGRALLSRKTPLWTKVLAGAAIAYTLSPVDVIPDVFPIIGIVDDIAFLTAAGMTLARITRVIRKELRDAEAKDKA